MKLLNWLKVFRNRGVRRGVTRGTSLVRRSSSCIVSPAGQVHSPDLAPLVESLECRAVLAAGDLDPSFDTDGKVVTNFGPGTTEDNVNYEGSMTLQADGKILLAGTSGGNFALARYNTNGSLDATFGTGGKVTTDFSGSDTGYAVAVQADGKIVVAGADGNFNLSLARYTTTGTLDTTFDGDGKVTTLVGSSFGEAFAVAVQADGKILAGGYADNASGFLNFALVRFNTNGSLDSTFDGDGKVVTAVGSADDIAYSMALQADGKILLTGASWNGTNDDLALVRYNTNGSLDTTFDGDGKVITTFGTAADAGYSVAVQADGKIVVAGLSRIGGTDDFALARWAQDRLCNGQVTSSVGRR